ncbi:APC family permease [Flavobacterium cerinum]|uniref:APC family permease n=1 Tax=Flavobacterium cerinum TaxID=2502784 RepID=A0A3S3QAA2_9FLAO|nr:APC family permease [Flavobacterium cerinum]RWX02422.1 APC family permease [Flavobacterium cerinum]
MQKQLSRFDLSMLVVSLVIGMGIFRTPVNVAQNAQTPELFYFAWIAGGLIALCGALTFAEIGSRFPVTGAYYKIFSTAYHPSVAFAINSIVIFTYTGATAGVTLIGSEYLCNVMMPAGSDTRIPVFITAFTSISVFFLLNLLGLKASSKIQNLLTGIKITLVLLLICAVFVPVPAETIQVAATPAPAVVMGWIDYVKAFGACMVAVSFSFTGYQQTINFGGETKDARKIMPGAIKTGLLIIITLYLLINYAYVEVIGFEQLKTSGSIAALLAERLFGPIGFKILSVLIFLSVLGYVNANLLACPRIMYAMGQDGALPRVFAKTTKNGTLITSLTVFTLITLVTLFFAKTFDKILNYTVFLDCLGTAFAAASIFFLRKKAKEADSKDIYKLKLYPVLPIVFIAAFLFVAYSIYAADPFTALTGIGIFLAFTAIYLIVRLIRPKTV